MYKVAIVRRKSPNEPFSSKGYEDTKFIEVDKFPAGRGKVLHHNTLRGLTPWLEGYYDVQIKAYKMDAVVIDVNQIKPSHEIVARVDSLYP